MPYDHKGNYIAGNHADRPDYETPPEDEEPLGFEPPYPNAYDDPNKLEDSSELLPSQQKRSDYRY
jgi:hypothetical protein